MINTEYLILTHSINGLLIYVILPLDLLCYACHLTLDSHLHVQNDPNELYIVSKLFAVPTWNYNYYVVSLVVSFSIPYFSRLSIKISSSSSWYETWIFQQRSPIHLGLIVADASTGVVTTRHTSASVSGTTMQS